ncbi:MAG: BamA/TamA family outer membrane protein, partial [Fidelibacterota bacterium]
MLLFLLLATWLPAEDNLPVITSIVVEGNEVTREHIILREISHPLNQPFDSTLAREDRNRLYNLGIFELVEVGPQPTAPGEAALVVEVVETIRVVPIPIFYHLEQLGWSYGGGVGFTNFRGLNQRLNLTATYGAEKTYTLQFADPWLFGNRISVTGWLLQVYRRHPVDSIRIEIRDAEIGMGKSSADKRLYVFGAASLERRAVHRLDERPDAPGDPTRKRPHHVIQTKFSLIWRTTDIWRDPTKGVTLSIGLTPVFGLDDHSPTYTRIGLSGAWFYPLRPGDRPLVFGVGGSISHYNKATSPYL